MDEKEALHTVNLALALGINLIDVSPFYGITRAEMVLGKALKGVPPDNHLLATKVGRYGDAEFDFSAQVPVAVSRRAYGLGVDYVDAGVWLEGLGVINASPLSQGLLTNRGTPAWHPVPESAKQTCAAAGHFCRTRGVDIAKIAIQVSVQNPAIATTLVGTADPANLKWNGQWANEPVDQDLLATVQEKLATVKNVTWTTGRPENN